MRAHLGAKRRVGSDSRHDELYVVYEGSRSMYRFASQKGFFELKCLKILVSETRL